MMSKKLTSSVVVWREQVLMMNLTGYWNSGGKFPRQYIICTLIHSSITRAEEFKRKAVGHRQERLDIAYLFEILHDVITTDEFSKILQNNTNFIFILLLGIINQVAVCESIILKTSLCRYLCKYVCLSLNTHQRIQTAAAFQLVAVQVVVASLCFPHTEAMCTGPSQVMQTNYLQVAHCCGFFPFPYHPKTTTAPFSDALWVFGLRWWTRYKLSVETI